MRRSVSSESGGSNERKICKAIVKCGILDIFIIIQINKQSPKDQNQLLPLHHPCPSSVRRTSELLAAFADDNMQSLCLHSAITKTIQVSCFCSCSCSTPTRTSNLCTS